jgi:signal transduction histidine kinase
MELHHPPQDIELAQVIFSRLLTDCNDAVRDWFTEIRWLALNTSINLRCGDYRLAGTPFWANRDEVLFLLHNLESNAEKAIKRKAERDRPADVTGAPPYSIIFSAAVREWEGPTSSGTPAAYIVLSVVDNGEGIPPSIQDRLFRGRTEVSRGGHGLGSQIIRRVMDNHRGLIRLTARGGVGSLVELWFPRLVSPSEMPLHDQWVLYDGLRQHVGPVGVIGEEALLAALATTHPTLT